MTPVVQNAIRVAFEQAEVPPHARILVGVSGGVDSLVLAHCLHHMGYQIVAVHVNYQLRGASSEADAEAVTLFCLEHGITLTTYKVPEAAWQRGKKRAVQIQGREIRYRQFHALAKKEGITWIATAHHRDDQAETVLLHLFRGSGIEGLSGIPLVRTVQSGSEALLIRPLLQVDKDALIAYAHTHHIAWQTDASNQSRAYKRNVVRNDIIPFINKAMGRDVTASIIGASEKINAYRETNLDHLLPVLFKALQVEHQGLRVSLLCALPDDWSHRVLLEGIRAWLPGIPQTAATVQEIASLRFRQKGKKVVFKHGTVWREEDALIFLPPEKTAPPEKLLTPNEEVQYASWLIDMNVSAADRRPLFYSRFHIVLDKDSLKLPLLVRRWRTGDSIQPFGMQGHKKISDLLTDHHILASKKKDYPVVCDQQGVVWVVGIQQDERTRLTEKTREIVQLRARNTK